MHYVEVKCMNKWELIKTEIHVQNEVLQELLLGDNPEKAFRIVDLCATLFRKIIEEFECSEGRPPTKDELIWVCSEKLKRNIRDLKYEL